MSPTAITTSSVRPRKNANCRNVNPINPAPRSRAMLRRFQNATSPPEGMSARGPTVFSGRSDERQMLDDRIRLRGTYLAREVAGDRHLAEAVAHQQNARGRHDRS